MPDPRYHNLGLAMVAGWEAGYFLLEGFAPDGEAHEPAPHAELDTLVARSEGATLQSGDFEPGSLIDGSERVVASIVRRRGQPEIRTALLDAHQSHQTNSPSNGLLPRADLCTLFDPGLLAIDTTSMTVVIAPRLMGTCPRVAS